MIIVLNYGSYSYMSFYKQQDMDKRCEKHVIHTDTKNSCKKVGRNSFRSCQNQKSIKCTINQHNSKKVCKQINAKTFFQNSNAVHLALKRLQKLENY